MAKLAVVVAQHYPNLRRDILLTGVLFHDIGKTREILYKRTFQFSQSGHLVGHLTQGVLILHEVARGLKDFPEEKVTLLTHLILSHHGSRDFGSPVLPMTAEAMALHYLDNLDAKMREVADKVDADVNPHSDFTAYLPALERRLYKK
jgi:3'-5' exoribonuclease